MKSTASHPHARCKGRRNLSLPTWITVVGVVALAGSPFSLAAAQEHSHEHGKQTSAHALPEVPPPDAAEAQVPEGYRVEVALRDLTYPTSVEFDGDGTLYIAEAGYSYGDDSAVPRVLRFTSQGKLEEVTRDLHGPVNDLLWHDGRMYVSHRGRISVLEGHAVRDLVTGLPSDGDHHNNQMTAGPDGKIYFGQGTATNSGVVGEDNAHMGWLKKHPDFHDVPARTVRLTGKTFRSPNPLTEDPNDEAVTGPFQPFGTASADGATVEGTVKASGTVLRMNPDGSDLEVYAWGLRNPYGVLWGRDGKLYATENGFDVRGSRPIANDWDDLYEIRQGAWYGWPDYAGGIPVTDPQFKPKDGPAPEFLLAEHPPVEKPLAGFPKHSAITKLDVSPGKTFGYEGQLFIAFFGHMVPMTGTVEKHGGHRVIRFDPATGMSETFFTKKEHGHGERGHGEGGHSGEATGPGTSQQGQGDGQGHGGGGSAQAGHGSRDESVTAGPRRLMDVRFSPDGDALYIVDFGTMVIDQEPKPVPGTGIVWKVTKTHP